MGLSAWVGKEGYEIGTVSFFKSFFSTIYVHLEAERWGSRFPVVMKELYSGRLKPERANDALRELIVGIIGLGLFARCSSDDRRPESADSTDAQIVGLISQLRQDSTR